VGPGFREENSVQVGDDPRAPARVIPKVIELADRGTLAAEQPKSMAPERPARTPRPRHTHTEVGIHARFAIVTETTTAIAHTGSGLDIHPDRY
jgi:hypothetical protein